MNETTRESSRKYSESIWKSHKPELVCPDDLRLMADDLEIAEHLTTYAHAMRKAADELATLRRFQAAALTLTTLESVQLAMSKEKT